MHRLAKLEICGRDRDRGICPAGMGSSASQPRHIATSTSCRCIGDSPLQLLEHRPPGLHIRNGMCFGVRTELSAMSLHQSAMLRN